MLKLYKSDDPSYHYMVVIHNVERIYIGDANCLTYVMASDRRRVCRLEDARVLKDEYEECMDRSKLGYFLNQEALEYYLPRSLGTSGSRSPSLMSSAVA